MTTPLFVCGAECGVDVIGVAQPTGSLRHWSAVDAGFVRSSALTAGAWSAFSYLILQLSAGTADGATHTFPTAISSGGTIVARFRFRIDSLTDAQARTVFSTPDGLAGVRVVRADAFGGHNLTTWAGNATADSDTVALISIETWYLIDITITRGTTITTTCQINGGAVGSATSSKTGQTATTIPGFRLGSNTSGTGGNTSTVVAAYIDDLCVSGTAGDYPIGDGRGEALYPDADGVHVYTNATDFKRNNSTNVATPPSAETSTWSNLQNPLDDAIGLWMAQTLSAAGNYLEWLFEPLTNGVTINGLAVVSSHHSSTTGANTQSLRLEDTQTENAILALVDYSDVTVSFNYDMYATSPRTGLPWKHGDVNNIRVRWGYSTDIVGVPYIDGVCLEVDYVPGTPPSDRLPTCLVLPVQAVHRASRW